MRRRAFTPDVLCPLEERVVLSAVGRLHGPYGLSATTYGQGSYLIKNAFQLYGVSGDFERLRAQLATYSVGTPYHRATMQGAKINAILQKMLADIHAHAPHPIKTAMHMVLKSRHDHVVKLIESRAIFVNRTA